MFMEDVNSEFSESIRTLRTLYDSSNLKRINHY